MPRFHFQSQNHPSNRLESRIQQRPWSDPVSEQAGAEEVKGATADFSHVDLFSHAPVRSAIQAKLEIEQSGQQQITDGVFLQGRWIDDKSGFKKWDRQGDSVWYYDEKQGLLAQTLDGPWQSYDNWISQGWGFPPNIKPRDLSGSLEEKKRYLKLVWEGRDIYEKALTKLFKQESEKAGQHKNIFDKFYKTDVDDLGGNNIKVSTNYILDELPNGLQQKFKGHSPPRGLGKFITLFKGAQINIQDSYALDVETLNSYGKLGLEQATEVSQARENQVPFSEIIHLQRQKAMEKADLGQLKNLLVRHVAGDGVPQIKDIRKATNNPGEFTVTEGDGDLYYALLAVVNVKPVTWFLHDNGWRYGITGIGAITVKGGTSGGSTDIDIHFK